MGAVAIMTWNKNESRILQDGEDLSRWAKEELEHLLKRYRMMTALEIAVVLAELKLREGIKND